MHVFYFIFLTNLGVSLIAGTHAFLPILSHLFASQPLQSQRGPAPPLKWISVAVAFAVAFALACMPSQSQRDFQFHPACSSSFWEFFPVTRLAFLCPVGKGMRVSELSV